MFIQRLMLIALLYIILFLCACAGNTTSQVTAQITESAAPAKTSKPTLTPEKDLKAMGQIPGSFIFRYNGVNISMGDGLNEIIAAIGEPSGVFEAKSCAFNGIEKTLFYNGFELYTYPDGGTDRVLSINITGDVQTKEGLGIGMTFDQMAAIYGDGYINSSSVYLYTADGTELRVVVSSGTIVQITYYNLNT